MTLIPITICTEAFDSQLESEQLSAANANTGALVTFTGVVREGQGEQAITEMMLEHYPGMTEKSISEIIDKAKQRWNILAARVIHRVGALKPGDPIVFVGVTSSHRGEAFAACEYIMDYLKTEAPFWKKETGACGERWVDARESDDEALQKWR